YGLLKGCKVGVSLFGKDYLASRPNPAYFLPLLFSLLLAQRIGVNSKSTLSLIPKALRRKARILYPGVDVEALEKAIEESSKHGEGETILFVGRMVRRKGPDLLLKAFAMLLKEHPDAWLVMVGDGPFLSSLKDLARQLKLEDRVEFTGALRGKPLYSRYAECDVFVMPSRQTATDVEGFGMVFLEAGFFGKPSVGTRTGGIPEAVLDGETGILVPQDDVGALQDALSLLLKDKAFAKRLGEKARERVLSEFTWEKATLRFIDLFS
ncbi:MAG: glycosyltransferase family 4 protein, partial [Candidatus Jordarchaeales archaeon]